MKPILLTLALTLATATSGVFAAPIATDGDNGSTTGVAPSDASRGLTWVQQIEAEKARLDREGFPQYN